ncbi:glycoside hydrolase family 2 TIM barrel-domain containing protein [Pelagicoccus sp. SDUM812003]|uniref:glycoside hydrolase family 2 TIM barrel-domain containing protein n=1 Tax=Pelagicoccus sp. SDUM812003 TaxID=3041267 RepID=UPI00280EF500|nr:glycoside hydrolase family 2 TIM barrel-domain containing protein [Pelagicoccus sp. SDUM812003]MDQ8202159.1 glycoside hydrolase family 2 TIM barrel-domain containing protein [Pelagicoccus sp. SDUM812003]
MRILSFSPLPPRLAFGLLALSALASASVSQAASQRERSFDADWQFLRSDALGAEAPDFDDSAWRTIDVPHDWSIEDLPQLSESTVGPFDPSLSEGGAYTGHVLGGIGWYRKGFVLNEADSGKLVSIRFDGVYMNADVWINGYHLGSHPYGYTSFEFDLTPHLKPAGQQNVIAVRVRNEGENSRWYSGSGIYRHCWLVVRNPIHVPTWGAFVTTPEVSTKQATVNIATEVRNDTDAAASIQVRARIHDAQGKVVKTTSRRLKLPAKEFTSVEQTLSLHTPKLWTPESPTLYTAEIEIAATDGSLLDQTTSTFGIRSIEVDAENGFRLNGQPILLKGCNVHHDNGPLGAAAIDRAEERRVELLKANGFNAIRCSHNPPSPAFLDACDRLGMLVIDEAFDCWNVGKKDQDYHLSFKGWAQRDIASMVRRDRNHPSVVIWSIGNEIPEQFRDEATAQMLREATLSHDSTRPITLAVCSDWGEVIKNWDTLSDVAFKHLDIGGYNYLPEKYESDHARHPDRVILGTESYPRFLYDYWSLVEKHPYVIGDFVWTAMDYFGESGIGHTWPEGEPWEFLQPWPWYNAWCGDLDVCGFKKPQSYYRDVVWGRSQIEMAVHAPLEEGVGEQVSGWGWPNESRSWNWSGQEGKPMDVTVYSRCEHVRLELNGKLIDEKPVSGETKLTVHFEVPYQPGELRAIGLIEGKPVADTVLRTTGAPAAIRLVPDRAAIRADRNDLSYVTVEIVDANGNRVPDAFLPVHFTVTGAGELAATGSAAPDDATSFHIPVRKTYQGRCLVILRPQGALGQITLSASADGLETATTVIETQ